MDDGLNARMAHPVIGAPLAHGAWRAAAVTAGCGKPGEGSASCSSMPVAFAARERAAGASGASGSV